MINVAIIDDKPQYLTTLSIILQLNENIRLLYKLEGCEQMIPLFELSQPDVVLMDIDMPGINGIRGVWELKKRWQEMKILMLTVFEDDEKIFGAIKAGANGYLLKKDSPHKILESVEQVYRGESPMNGVIASKVLSYFQSRQQKYAHIFDCNLTDREKQILHLLNKGLSYKEISSSLTISTETLNSHIKSIYRKLDVHSRSELSARYGNDF